VHQVMLDPVAGQRHGYVAAVAGQQAVAFLALAALVLKLGTDSGLIQRKLGSVPNSRFIRLVPRNLVLQGEE
jgi:hypothetical protein